MLRSELAHVLRASSAISNETTFRLVTLDTLVERIRLLDAAKNNLTHITQWSQRRAQEANA